MKLSDFLMFPQEKTVSHDGLELTTFANAAVTDEKAAEILKMMVDATSMDEVRMVLTLMFSEWGAGELKPDVGRFGEVLGTEIGVFGENVTG